MGRFYLKRRKESDDLEKAIQNFSDAKDLDPKYAKAWAGIASAYLLQSLPGTKNAVLPDKAVANARLAAQKALDLDNTLSDSYVSLGQINASYDWNWQEAERNFRLAIAQNPEHIVALMF